MADSNSLGLDFEKETAVDETAAEQEPKAEKKKPYVNPERVKTGGPQRVRVVLWGRGSTDGAHRKSPLTRSLRSACSA